MAMHLSPKIATDGLVFAYDMNNAKSFRGAPVTNLVSDAAAFSGWSNYWRTDYINTFQTEFGTTGYRISGNPSWNGVYRGISVPSTGTYTLSAYFRYWGGTTNNNGATVYCSGWGGGDSANALNKSLIGVWQRVSLTLNFTNTSCTFYIISYGGDSSGRADCSTWDVTMPQLESGSFATGFANGTRSSTQAVVDYTNNYTLTVNNLTYNADNTFNFNGASWLDLNSNNIITGNQAFTVESWYTTTGTTADEIFGNYGSASTSNTLWVSGRYGIYINSPVYFPGAPIGAGTYHLVATRNSAGNVVLYRNGVQQNTGTLSASIAVTYNFRIGADVNGGAEPFTGKIHSVNVYNRALTSAEVQQNFNALRGRYGI